MKRKDLWWRNDLWGNDEVPNKLKCDHCGAIIDSGIMNCIRHQEECGANVYEEHPEILGGVTFVFSPYMSFSPIKTTTA